MRSGHGKMVMAAVMAVMAVMACQVRFDGTPTPAAMTATKPASPSPSMTATPVMEGECLVVRASPGDDGALNLRKGPGVEYPVVIALPDGAQIERMSSAGGWIKVRAGGRTGYVRAIYVRPCD